MALRTRSTSARAAIAASRIKQSETERLQSAIRDMEKAIGKYNKDKKKRSNKRGLWGALGKLGSIVTKAGAYVGNPLIAGAGLAVSGVSGYAEGSLSKKQAEKFGNILFMTKNIKPAFVDINSFGKAIQAYIKKEYPQYDLDAQSLIGKPSDVSMLYTIADGLFSGENEVVFEPFIAKMKSVKGNIIEV